MLEQRQFGRRDSSIRGRAVVSGRAPRAFTIRNISDGGALLEFDEPIEPLRSLRIEVEGFEISILCEVRHQGRHGVGIRFVRLADGIALNRHFQPQVNAASVTPPGEVPPRVAPPMAAPSGSDLRRSLGIRPRSPH